MFIDFALFYWLSLDVKKPQLSGSLRIWCPERDLNSHAQNAQDFKSWVSTDSTIRALIELPQSSDSKYIENITNYKPIS